jgi:hypothetical protein
MVGFVESLNVSVAAAITLHAATRGRAPLPEEDRTALVARWLLRTVRDGPALVARNLSY